MTFADQAEAAGRELQEGIRQLAELARSGLKAGALLEPRRPRVRFRGRVTGRFGTGGKKRDAIVTIDRALTFHVRPYKGRKLYSLPLDVVAAWAFQKLAMAEAAKRRQARRGSRARR